MKGRTVFRPLSTHLHTTYSSRDVWLRRNYVRESITSLFHVENSGPVNEDLEPRQSENLKENRLGLESGEPHVSQALARLSKSMGSSKNAVMNESVRNKLGSIVSQFKAPIRFAFAYGSGVFCQGPNSRSATDRKPMVDLVFGISYSDHWHYLNLQQHRSHYSFLKYLGASSISWVQDNLGAGIYYNPYVNIDGIDIKYGVINTDTLKRDLSTWDTLYVAGRLHKPVMILRDDPSIHSVNKANLLAVLRTALLLLPKEFTEKTLYRTIAGISYMGDPRMQFGEHPKKVLNIVENQFSSFRSLYAPMMDKLSNLSLISVSKEKCVAGVSIADMSQDMSSESRGYMVSQLPSNFKRLLYKRYEEKVKDMSALSRTPYLVDRVTELDCKIAEDSGLRVEVARSIRDTVAWSSLSQSSKGILTAGLGKSIKYALSKLSKARN